MRLEFDIGPEEFQNLNRKSRPFVCTTADVYVNKIKVETMVHIN